MRVTLDQAVAIVKNHGVIGLPTETVYGLAAHYTSEEGIAKIYALKCRPKDNPLIIHAANLDELRPIVSYWDEEMLNLANTFWPGPLTMIVSANELTVPKSARASLPSVAVRIPSHPLARALLLETGPLVAPSANLSGKPSSTHPKHIEEDFGLSFPILDGGVCTAGVESTIIVKMEQDWKIARLGAVDRISLENILGRKILTYDSKVTRPICPGQKYRHYAPKARLILGNIYLGDIPYVLGFLGREYPNALKVISMGDLNVPEQIAFNLYDTLRQLDLDHIDSIWVDWDFPKEGILETIAERISKAASN